MAFEKDTLASVLVFLRSRGLKDTEEILRREAGEDLLQAVDDSEFTADTTAYPVAGTSEEPAENETAILNINKAKVYYGLPKEPDITIPADFKFSDDEDDTEDESDKEPPNKRRKISKKDFFARRFKSDPNAPPPSRVLFPPLSDLEKQDKLNGWKDALKSARLGKARFQVNLHDLWGLID
jgi:transcription initiation factor TFIID subunit 5